MKPFSKGLQRPLFVSLMFLMTWLDSNGQQKSFTKDELYFQRSISLYKDTMIDLLFRLDSLRDVEYDRTIMLHRQEKEMDSIRYSGNELKLEKMKKENRRFRTKNTLLGLALTICIVVISIIQ